MLPLPQVIGGGYIGLEFSGIFQRFGTEVHTIFRQKLPLRGFDEEVRDCLSGQVPCTDADGPDKHLMNTGSVPQGQSLYRTLRGGA